MMVRSDSQSKSIKVQEISDFIRKSCRRECCAKLVVNEGEYFEGDAACFENEHDVIKEFDGK
jgi:hypothetical protein